MATSLGQLGHNEGGHFCRGGGSEKTADALLTCNKS